MTDTSLIIFYRKLNTFFYWLSLTTVQCVNSLMTIDLLAAFIVEYFNFQRKFIFMSAWRGFTVVEWLCWQTLRECCGGSSVKAALSTCTCFMAAQTLASQLELTTGSVLPMSLTSWSTALSSLATVRPAQCYQWRQTDNTLTDGRRHIANVNVSSRSLYAKNFR